MLVCSGLDVMKMPYLNLVAPVCRVNLLKVVVHDETLVGQVRLLNAGIHDVTRDSKPNKDQAKCNPVADLGLFHSWIVFPWQFAARILVSWVKR